MGEPSYIRALGVVRAPPVDRVVLLVSHRSNNQQTCSFALWARTGAHCVVVRVLPHRQQVVQASLLSVNLEYVLGVPAIHDLCRVTVREWVKPANEEDGVIDENQLMMHFAEEH